MANQFYEISLYLGSNLFIIDFNFGLGAMIFQYSSVTRPLTFLAAENDPRKYEKSTKIHLKIKNT